MFQAKMITGKITKNFIKNLGFREKKNYSKWKRQLIIKI